MNYDVAVVGSGFSAIALTINLLRVLPRSASIALVGDDPGFGRGTAYRTEFHLHRLNVPAGRMSVFSDIPDDFVDWLRRRGKSVSPAGFAPRGDYGLYLRDTLASLLRPRDRRASVDFIRAKASDCIRCEAGGMVLSLNGSEDLMARNIILALGVGSAGLPVPKFGIEESLRPRIVENPWRLSWLSKVGQTETVCILGSGLTMIDQVMSLRGHGHRGQIHVLSRRGLVPHPHLKNPSTPVQIQMPGSRQISSILQEMRRAVRSGSEWRAVVDGLRPVTQDLWQSLDRDERARFLRHGLAWWNIHRHRIAPEVFERFDSLMKSGSVIVHAGYLSEIRKGDNRAEVGYLRRGLKHRASLEVDWIINCTGMERAGIGHSPLLQAMVKKGMLSLDELGLGIAVDRSSRVLDERGNPRKGLFAAGALTAGQFWEITAVPDIRAQAKAIAELIGTELGESALHAGQEVPHAMKSGVR